MIGPRQIGLQGELHRNKRSVAINMAIRAASSWRVDSREKRPGDRQLLGARDAQWGMDYESLAKIKPDIICVSMSGLGHTGPRSNYVSYGPTLQALAGYTSMMADERGGPPATATRTPIWPAATPARWPR